MKTNLILILLGGVSIFCLSLAVFPPDGISSSLKLPLFAIGTLACLNYGIVLGRDFERKLNDNR
jgi:hypothetical protein